MFFTGAFTIDGICAQKIHEREQYDDNVISWISEEEKNLHSDGYVSNKGTAATIHIHHENMNDADIKFIKTIFCLSEENGVSEVRIMAFSGWDIEVFIRGITKGPFRVLNYDDCSNADSTFVTENNRERDIFQCAVYQAWLDMCRTLHSGSKNQKEQWNKDREYVAASLREYFGGNPKMKEEAFDGWYYSVVSAISIHKELTIGQAQKLINMAFKYLYCCSDIRSEKRDHFTCCHMPLDGYTLKWFKREVDQEYDGEVWSKINKVKKYADIVQGIRNYLGSENLLTGEFKIWQEEKKKAEIKELCSCADKIKKSADCSPKLKELLDEYCVILG